MMDSFQLFDDLTLKIGQLLYGRNLTDRNGISKALDELNSLNYIYPIVKTPTKAVLLINQLCTSVPADDEALVPKCALVITNFITKQSVLVEGRTLTMSVQWCLQACKNSNEIVLLEVLKALEALTRKNVQNILMLLDLLVREVTWLHTNKVSCEVVLASLKCLEASLVIDASEVEFSCSTLLPHFEQCYNIFLQFLCRKTCPAATLVDTKILEVCLLGLENIVLAHPEYLKKELGTILGIIKSYMLYKIKDIEFLVPDKLTPTTMHLPEITQVAVKEKTGGKVTKQRKHRGPANKKKDRKSSEQLHNDGSKSGNHAPSFEYNSDSGLGCNTTVNGRLRTSDSDFSDTEGGNLAKLTHQCNRVRQAALNLFAAVIKHTEKAVMFTYWSSFIPDSPSSGQHNLLTAILKDHSTRGKMCALNALLLLLSGAKVYLLQGESSEKACSFTPFSVVIGLMLTELHQRLCMALKQFTMVPVLTQILKCLAALVQATPYHRLSTGLITKIIRNIKGLVSHRDASVQVTALIVASCLLAFEPPLAETKLALTQVELLEVTTIELSPTTKANNKDDEFDYAQFSSDEDNDDVATSEVDTSMPWLLQKCLRNLGVAFDDSGGAAAPVKLESLQVLSAMSRNYFEELMQPHLVHITKGITLSLEDKYADLRLHAGRAVDFLGQAIGRLPAPTATCLNFWLGLLKGPLVALVQDEREPLLRGIGCDCLGSIGPQIFQQFPRDKQILCVTLLFACTKDGESSVRGAAVRALALCVLYPSLREDPGFVVDTAECILLALKDEQLNVRVKASWSLGNLSDALVLNSKSLDAPSDEALPDHILLQLLEAAIKMADENEKIKSNVVRALGNLVQLINADLMRQDRFKTVAERALNALVKASTSGSIMKVRWNACYALGNALKNPCLYTSLEGSKWQSEVFTKLSELVLNFKNFKVRINAALALSSPSTREHYGRFFIPIWTSLLQALENSQNIDDFTEYKHKDHLVEQICLCLGHLTTCLTKEDLPQLDTVLNWYYETFRTHMRRVTERLVPEKSGDLFSAVCALTTLESRGDICGATEKRTIQYLRTIFVVD